MTIVPRRLHLVVAACLFLASAAGCGGASSPRTVSGKIVPLPNMKLLETDALNLTFIPEGKDGKTVVAQASPKDMTFTTNEAVPGKYKITVSVEPYPGELDSEKRAAAFEPFNEAFAEERTNLTYEVTQEPQQSITIDLAKGTVTKQ